MIPLLITLDLEVANDHNMEQQGAVLEKLSGDLKSMGVNITGFATSDFAMTFPEQVKLLKLSGNEIACHGLHHNKKENYKLLNKEIINEYISTASNEIEKISGEKPVCFRGPGMTTSSRTHKVLIELGYKADFSLCSQRIDFINSAGGDIRWLFAPRLPYFPSEYNPYKKGNLPIRVIPLSCLLIPFISGILYICGFNFMKFIFRMLIKESLRTQKPIVYLFHSYEFSNPVKKSSFVQSDNDKRYSPIHKLYRFTPEERYQKNLELIKYMLSFNSLHPFTGNEYITKLNKDNN